MDINIGDKVRLTKSIFDDGEDHHPPCFLALIDEVLIIKSVRGKTLAVAHEHVTDDRAFRIYEGEYELVPNV